MLGTLGHIVLCGFMGAGKTTAGRIVAERLGRPFTDMDEVLVERLGKPIADVFAEDDGEDRFRTAESELAEELARNAAMHVIAAGGGMVLEQANRAAFSKRGHQLVHLAVTAADVSERLAGVTDRPLLAGDPATRDARIERLLDRRHVIYASLPIQVDTSERSAEEVADAIIRIFA